MKWSTPSEQHNTSTTSEQHERGSRFVHACGSNVDWATVKQSYLL